MPNFTLSATEHVRMIGEHFLNFIGYLNADDEAMDSGVLYSVIKDKIYSDLSLIAFGVMEKNIQV